MDKRLVVGISGASGAPLAVELLKVLGELGIQRHLVITRGGEMVMAQESGISLEEVKALAEVVYDNHQIGAAPASGSWKSMGMVVVPCSMKTVAGISVGYSDNLLLRSADCMLKERRKLVLVARETPYSAIHLKNMLEVTQAGAVVLPMVMTYYSNAETIQQMNRHLVGKILDQFGIECPGFCRWEG